MPENLNIANSKGRLEWEVRTNDEVLENKNHKTKAQFKYRK